MTMKKDGVEQAFSLLSNILNEIALNDSPPSNEIPQHVNVHGKAESLIQSHSPRSPSHNPSTSSAQPLSQQSALPNSSSSLTIHAYHPSKYSRQIHNSTSGISPTVTPTNSIPSSLSPRYRNSMSHSPSTESSFSANSNYSLGKSESFEDGPNIHHHDTTALSPQEEEAYSKAKAISTMGNSSLALYMYNTLETSYPYANNVHDSVDMEMFAHSIAALERFSPSNNATSSQLSLSPTSTQKVGNSLHPRHASGSLPSSPRLHIHATNTFKQQPSSLSQPTAISHSTSSLKQHPSTSLSTSTELQPPWTTRQRLNSKSQTTTTGTYSPTTSGQTSESGSHNSLSSKNSTMMSLGVDTLWTPSNSDNELSGGNTGSGGNTEEYDYHHEAILSAESEVFLSDESDEENKVEDSRYDKEREARKRREEELRHLYRNVGAHQQQQQQQQQQNGNVNLPQHQDPTLLNSFSSKALDLRVKTGRSINYVSPSTSPTTSNPSPTTQSQYPNKRIQMFGSEYARFLSSTVLSPAIPRKKKSIMQSLSRIKENKSSSITPKSNSNPSHLNHPSITATTSANSNNLPPSSSTNAFLQSRLLEDAPHAILTGPVTDMVITLGNELPPRGFYRISLTAEGHKADLTNQSGGTSLYLNVKKESNWDRAAQRPSVTALAVIFPDRQEVVPPGFCFVRRIKEKRKSNNIHGSSSRAMAKQQENSTIPANLNFGTRSSERIYLCFKKSREGNPITGIVPLMPGKAEAIPDGYTVLERTPRNFVADVNAGAGQPMFLAIRQRLSNLETLRPKPLLQIHRSHLSSASSSLYNEGNGDEGIRSGLDPTEPLHGYFCTGGTVVKSQVGDLHIMDRSTHTMLSPSSVTNRLSLIHQSRDGTEGMDVVKLQKRKPRRRTSPAPPKDSKSYVSGGSTGREAGVNKHRVGGIGGRSKSHKRGPITFLDVGGRSVEMGDGDSIESNSTAQSPKHHLHHHRNHNRGLSWKNTPNSPSSSQPNSPRHHFTQLSPNSLHNNHIAFDFIPYITDGTGETLCDPARIQVITPIFTACYTQHGRAAMLAVEGLLDLLHRTDFFASDLRQGDKCDEHCVTLLDLAIQVVCDVATGSCRETSFKVCVDFVSGAIRFAKGNVGPRTFGYVLRFYLFVFYFGANVATSNCWPHTMKVEDYYSYGRDVQNHHHNKKKDLNGILSSGNLGFHVDIPLLADTVCGGNEQHQQQDGDAFGGSFVGAGMGAPQASVLCFKEMLTLVLKRLGEQDGREETGAPPGSSAETTKIDSNTISHRTTTLEGPFLTPSKETDENINNFIQNLILGMISNSAKRVDVNNITELAIHQIHRSGGSELFWHDMVSSCGFELFGENSTYSLAFGILSNLVKVASGFMRRVKETQELVPRDVATKLLTLELVSHFLDCAGISIGDHFRTIMSSETPKWSYHNSMYQYVNRNNSSSNHLNYTNSKQQQDKKVLSYTIRRLVVPLVLSNTTAGLEDPRVLRRLLKIITRLWSSFRTHLKVEIAVLLEHFLIRVLRLGPQVGAFSNRNSSERMIPSVYLDHQLDVLSEVELWIENPIDLLELFLNYDMGDASSATHWKACQQICATLCKLAEQCGNIIAQQINSSRMNSEMIHHHNDANSNTRSAGHLVEDVEELAQTRDAARSLQEKSLDVICHIVRLMMDASHQAYDKRRKVNPMVKRILGEGSWDSNESSNTDFSTHGLPYDQSIDAGEIRDFADDISETSFSSVESPLSPGRDSLSPRRQQSRKPLTPTRKTSSSFQSNSNSPTPYPDIPQISPRQNNPKFSSSVGQQIASNRLKPPGIEKPPRHPVTKNVSATTNNNNNVFRAPLQLRRHKSKVDELEEDQKRTHEALKVAFEIIENKNNGLKKALDYLIACNFLLPGPRDVASFLRIHKQRIDPSILGEYLGEGGHAGDGEYWKLVRYHYVRATSFVGMNVEYGLRSFLTKSGFRLPGEAQKVDRLITTFAQCFWEDNVGDHTTCPFQHRDTVHVVAFAIIILNTDLHRAGATGGSGGSGKASSKKKEGKKMTRDEFLKILRDVDESKSVSKLYIYSIYDSIAAYPIELHEPQPQMPRINNNSKIGSFSAEDRMLNDASPPTSPTSTTPITEFFAPTSDADDLNSTAKVFVANVKPALELLRGLAIHEQTFVTARDDESALSCEFLSHVFKSLWHHFYGIVNATLDAVQLDPQSIASCLSVLRYAICTTIYLDMKVERTAFISQLARIKYLKERGLEDGARIGLSQQGTNFTRGEKYKEEPWHEKLNDVSSCHENVLNAVDQVTSLTRELRRAMQIDSRLNQAMHKVTRRIRNGEILLSDPTRSFIREGDLLKRCNRSGRYVLYRFFLFSDVLIYTHKSSNRGDYKIHEELPLYLMKITSVAHRKGDKKKYSFQIHHPKKSFLVCAPTAESKSRWMEDIATVISSSLDRKAGVHGARIGSAPKKKAHS